MTASFVNVATAVTCLANDERLYWYKHCKRSLLSIYLYPTFKRPLRGIVFGEHENR